MDRNGGGGKVIEIRQTVRLKELLQKWKYVTLTPKPYNPQYHSNGKSDIPIWMPPTINKKLKKDLNWRCDLDEETCQCPELLHVVPKGYLAIYVGQQENRRFIVPTSCNSDQLFKVLLEKIEEEYGFEHDTTLMLPCDVKTSKYLLKFIGTSQREDYPDDNNNIGICSFCSQAYL